MYCQHGGFAAMTRLANANTSQEIKLSRYSDKKDLFVLVEGDDDIPFWALLFQEYKK